MKIKGIYRLKAEFCRCRQMKFLWQRRMEATDTS